MQCSNCSTVGGIRDGNHYWCDSCGSSMKQEVQYVTGYCQSHYARSQIYCRVKRFGKYISRVCQDPTVLNNYYKILDLYACFEFAWMRHIQESNRIYFFAKPVMLKMCCALLDITADLPGLKDKNRELDQLRELKNLQASREWQSMHSVKKMGNDAGPPDPYNYC